MKKIILIIVTILAVVAALVLGFLFIRNDNNTFLKYEVIDNANSIEGTKSGFDRDYEVVKNGNEYYLIIYAGEQPTTDTLEVSNVEVDGKNVIVTVNLIMGSGDAFSYPKAIIKFNEKPKSIEVIYEYKDDLYYDNVN